MVLTSIQKVLTYSKKYLLAIKSSKTNVISSQKWVEHFLYLLSSENEGKDLLRNNILKSPFTVEKVVKDTKQWS